MFFKNYIRKQYVVHMINLEIEKLCKKRQSLHNVSSWNVVSPHRRTILPPNIICNEN